MITKEQAEHLLSKYEKSLKDLQSELTGNEAKQADHGFITKVLNALRVVAEVEASNILTAPTQNLRSGDYNQLLMNLRNSESDEHKQFKRIVDWRLTPSGRFGNYDQNLINSLNNFLKDLSELDLSFDKNPFKAEPDHLKEEEAKKQVQIITQKQQSSAAATWKFAMGFITGCVAFCEVHKYIPQCTKGLMVNNPYMHLTSALVFPLVLGGVGCSRYGWVSSAACSAWGIYSSVECKEIKNFVNVGVGVIGILVNYLCRSSAAVEKA
jgi:hypothetical protein